LRWLALLLFLVAAGCASSAGTAEARPSAPGVRLLPPRGDRLSRIG